MRDILKPQSGTQSGTPISVQKMVKKSLFFLRGQKTKEIQEILSDKGIKTDWIYLDGKTFNSGIILYNGKSLNFKNPDVGEKEIELNIKPFSQPKVQKILKLSS